MNDSDLEYTIYRVGIFECDGGTIEEVGIFNDPYLAIARREDLELDCDDFTFFTDVTIRQP